MNYLLNTNVFLWSINDDPKLPDAIQQILQNNNNAFYLSIVSLWEMTIKIGLGKLKLDTMLPDLISDLTEMDSIRILSVSEEHIYPLEKLPFFHRDPFDRLLVTQAFLENMTFLYTDEIFKQYEDFFKKNK